MSLLLFVMVSYYIQLCQGCPFVNKVGAATTNGELNETYMHDKELHMYSTIFASPATAIIIDRIGRRSILSED